MTVGRTKNTRQPSNQMSCSAYRDDDTAKGIVKTLRFPILKLPVQECKVTTSIHNVASEPRFKQRVRKEKKTQQQRAHGLVSKETLSTCFWKIESFYGGMWPDRAGLRKQEDTHTHTHALARAHTQAGYAPWRESQPSRTSKRLQTGKCQD